MDTPPNGIDPKFFNEVAQFAHFGIMYSINLTLALPLLWYHHIGLTIVILIVCVLYATWHEFVHDPEDENAATRGSDLEDFIFLNLGIFGGQGMAVLFVHFLK